MSTDSSEEPPSPSPTYADARDELLVSSENKQSNALKHFDFFLQGYCVQIGAPVVKAEDIPYHGLGLPSNATSKDVNAFWDKLFGAFFTYLGTAAKVRLDPKGPRLAYQSATGYASSVKVYFSNKFRNEDPIPVFQKEPWNKLRGKLRGKYRESNRASGKKVVSGKAPSTKEDREAMATGCSWLCTAESAEFWHLLTTSYHCAGRGSEVSLVTVEGVNVIEVNEGLCQYEILQLDVQRQKDGPFQEVAIYPHRDSIFQDFYFSLIHLVVVTGCSGDYIFPRFSKAALNTKSGRSDSKVSALWMTLFDELRNTFESLAVRINDKLGSHSHKKGSNQDMAETSAVSGLAQIFRTGWELRGCDTLFEYICGSFVMSRDAGKVVAGWTLKSGDQIVGGQPPSLKDILPRSNMEGLKRFIGVLFADDVEGRWSQKVRELLVMSLLLRYNDYCQVLCMHPEASKVHDEMAGEWEFLDGRMMTNLVKMKHGIKFTMSSLRDNLFVNRVEQALAKAGVDELEFWKWVEEAKESFVSRNVQALPVEKLPEDIASKIQIDLRTFTDYFNTLASTTQQIHYNVISQGHLLKDLARSFEGTCRFNDDMVLDRLCKIEESLRVMAERGEAVSKSEKPAARVRPIGVIKFSINVKGLSSQAPVSEVFTAFFVDDYPSGFELDKASDTWKDFSVSERKSIRNNFAKLKRVVRMMLMQSDTYPTSDDKEAIRRIALAAEEKIRNDWGFEKNKVITVHRLTSHPQLKELEKSSQLPINTPEEARKFFTSMF